MREQDQHDNQLLVEIEKKFGSITTQEPLKNWNDNKERDFQNQIKQKQKEKYLRDKERQKIEKDGILIPKDHVEHPKSELSSCSSCQMKYSVSFKDQVYIKKFGICYKCYIKHNL